jgi:hypothetical protein
MHFMTKVKRIKAGLAVLAITGIFFLSCEKFDGAPPALAARLPLNQLVFTPAAGAPQLPPIPLDSLQQLIINDAGMQAVVNIAEYANPIPIESVGKIIFQ